MEAEERAIVVDLIHIEAVETQAQAEAQQQEHEPELEHRPGRTEASSAVRTAACVAPSPPDPDYFVG